MREIDVVKIYPDITVHCEELDQMYDTSPVQVDMYQCRINLPANPTYVDKVYHFRAHANGNATEHVATVTVLGRELVEEYLEIDHVHSFPEVLPSSGGECIICICFNSHDGDGSGNEGGGGEEVPVWNVWGVRIDTENSDPATCVTATDDLIDSVPDFGERPCLLKNGVVQYYLDPNNFNLKEDGTTADIASGADGDVMIEIPRMAWFMEYEGNTLIVKLTDSQNAKAIDPRFKYLAHTRDTEGDREKLYVGAYQASELSNQLRSLSGKTPLASNTIAQFRTKAQANGAGYDILSFYPMTLLQVMYLMKYKNLNSQTVLGQGVTTGSVKATGGTETKGMYWGSQSTTEHIKFSGIEDWYGNLNDRIDGVATADDYSLLTAFKNFNDTSLGYVNRGKWLSAEVSGFLKKPHGTTETGFLMKEAEGSATTYFCDSCLIRNSRPFGYFGGAFSKGSNAGAFYLDITHTTHTPTDGGARCMYL